MIRGDLVKIRWVEGMSPWTEIVELNEGTSRDAPRLILKKSGEIGVLLQRKGGTCVILSAHGQVTILKHYVTRFIA